MRRAAARAAALAQREAELDAIRGGLVDWPPEPMHKLIRGTDGVTRATLARALGCTPQALGKVLPDPVGIGITSNRPYDLYDPDLVHTLAGAEEVRASRLRRSVRVTDTDRRNRISMHMSDFTGIEIRRVEVGSFRQVGWLSFEASTLTVLFGKNGAGKSTIVEALRRGLGRRTPVRSQPNEEDLQVGLELRVHVSKTADETAILASYLALGIREPERSFVEELWTALLSKPFAYGTPGRWMLACDPSARSTVVPVLGKISDVNRRIQSKVTEEMVDAFSSAATEPYPVNRVDLRLPDVRVLSLSDDISSIARDLHERIGEHLRPLHRQLVAAAESGVEDLEPDDGSPTGEPHEPMHVPLHLAWLDDTQAECAPAAADAVLVKAGGVEHLIPLRDVRALRQVMDEVGQVLSGWDEAAVAALGALYTVARYGGPGEVTSAWVDPLTRDEAIHLAAEIDTRANELAPPFVQAEGRIVLLPPMYESAAEVGIVLLSADGSQRSLEQLPSGIARWVGLVVDLAAHEVLSASASRRFGTAGGVGEVLEPVLFLADEPELHLHPAAQEEIVAWMIKRSETSTSIVATHAAPFLRLSPSEGQVVHVLQHPTEGVKALPLRGSLLGELDELSRELGLGRDWVLQLVRGVVFVEGLVDREVLRCLARGVLDRSRLLVVPVHGHSQTKALAQAELMLALGMPVAVLFDCITAGDLDVLSKDPKAKVADEARSAQRLLSMRERGLDCTVIPYDDGDICGAIPEETVRASFPAFPGWDAIRGVVEEHGEISFKHAFLDSINVKRQKDAETIAGLAESWDGHAPLPSPFVRAIEALDAWADELGTRGSLAVDSVSWRRAFDTA